jgi:hypothetical protein
MKRRIEHQTYRCSVVRVIMDRRVKPAMTLRYVAASGLQRTTLAQPPTALAFRYI